MTEPRPIGRYLMHGELAVGGMGRVSLGTLRGEGAFTRVVAIKQLFPQYAKDPEFVAMFLDEAHVAARVQHPNVVGTLDIVSDDGELFLVMEYIAGETLSRLLATAREAFESIEPAIVSAILIDLLEGLHAAHTATGPAGAPLDIVHRDVSPQNVLVGVDGVSRVVDFGVAKAAGRMQKTEDGQLKGKLVYMPPEQVGGVVDRRADVWAAGAVLWEMLAGRRLFQDVGEALAFHSEKLTIDPPSTVGKRTTPLDDVALRALSRAPDDRYPTARDMIVAIERAVPPAPARRVAQWVQRLAAASLAKRRELVAAIEVHQPETTAPVSATPSVVPSVAPPIPPAPPRRQARVAAAFVVVGLLATGGVLAARQVTRRAPPSADRTTATAEAVVSAAPSAPPPTEAAPSASVAEAAPSSRPEPSASVALTTGKPPTITRPRQRSSAHAAQPTGTESEPAATAAPPSAVDAGDPRELHRRK